jgi:hypothetical protein
LLGGNQYISQKERMIMTKINAEPHALNRKMPGRPSPSWARAAVLVGSLASGGLALVPIQVAHADPPSTNVDCTPNDLINAISSAVSSGGAVLSLAQGCLYGLSNPVLDPIQDPNLGPNGLPVITQKLTINGNGATITRQPTSTTSFRIFAVLGDLTLNDVTLTNGAALGDKVMDNFRPGEGGAILNLGILRVNHSTLSHNQAKFFGGGIGSGDAAETANPVGGDVTLSDSVISDGTAGADGGAIGNGIKSTIRLTGCTISGNKGDPSLAGNTFGGVAAGGGIASQGAVFVDRCFIIGNTANLGGGVVNEGQMFLTDSPVTGNTANAVNGVNQPTGFGGGILNKALGAVTLTDSPVTGNKATNDGAGIENFSPGTVATLTSSAVNNNNAGRNAGGIGNAGSLTLINSTVSGNSAMNDAGGIANASSLTLMNSIVSGNKTGKYGGGIANESVIPGTLAVAALTGSVVTGNSAVNVPNSGGGIFNQSGSQAGTVCLNGTVVAGNSPNDSTNVVFAPLCQ